MKFNLGKIVNVPQGSDLWHALRGKRRTASEAPAAAGKSKYMTRNALLDQKATGLVPEIDAHQQRIFNDGHAAEAGARPLAEDLIDDELFPVVLDDAEGGFLASMDGLTMDRKIGFEHKLYSESLAKQIDAGQLEEHYMLQLDQQFALSGAEKILFVASDGTDENFKHLWVERDESRLPALLSIWEQFDKDLAEHTPAEPEQPKAEGKAPDALPALSVQVQGMVTASNLKAFEESARATLAKINTDLQTDEDFSTAEKTVKFCKDVEKRLDSTKENVLSQMASVDEVVRSIDAIKEETRQIRLKLDKAVKEQKEQRKLEILNASRTAWQKHLGDLEKALESEAGGLPVNLNTTNADFAGAMKGLKTMSSIRSACDDEMARAKITANETAELVRGNIRQLNEHAPDHKFLFRDFGQICQKPAEDFAAIVKSRIAEHKEAEQKRLDAEREKIRQEEEAKASRIADEKARREEAVADEAIKEQHEDRQKSEQRSAPKPNSTETVTISRKEYDQLVHNSKMYLALAAAGVDDWEGYGMAMEIMQEAA